MHTAFDTKRMRRGICEFRRVDSDTDTDTDTAVTRKSRQLASTATKNNTRTLVLQQPKAVVSSTFVTRLSTDAYDW